MILQDIIQELESGFPLKMQESYDNCGLIYGNRDENINAVLICLDITEEIVHEAITKKCSLIIAHHPLIYNSIKQINTTNYIHKALIECIKHNIAIYALHTNLDNHYKGVNFKIGEKIGVKNSNILLEKKNTLRKLVVFIPNEKKYIDSLDKELFHLGAGKIGNYDECHFRSEGIGTFRPLQNANPVIGKTMQKESIKECRIEYLIPKFIELECIDAMKRAHPYEEVAFEIYNIENSNPSIGSGMIAELENPMNLNDFLKFLKNKFNCRSIRFSPKNLNKQIEKVAWCGGSGSFLMENAKRQGADVFISSDFKYHDFFKSSDSFVLIDIGHYESEQFTIELIADFLKEKFSKFAIHLTEINTNPINYI